MGPGWWPTVNNNVRGSFNQKDAQHTGCETAGQDRPPRSIQQLRVEPAQPHEVADVITRHHYLHSMPSAPVQCFAVWDSGELVGSAVFTAGARHAGRLLAGSDTQQVITLARFWMADDVAANGESRVLGYILRWLRKHTTWKCILSYADPAEGHRGTIYQATGWLYLGETDAQAYVDLGDGVLHHPRSVYARYGTNNMAHLRATGIPAQRVKTPPKHRYAYVLDSSWRWRLTRRVEAYPRGRDPPGRSLTSS